MLDIARLGIVIDASQVRSAANDLSVWNAEATRAEKKTSAAARAIDDMNGKVRVAGGTIGKANAEVIKLAAANGKVAANATTTFAVAQLINSAPPTTQASASGANRSMLDFSHPTGYSNFDFIRERASGAGEPLRKSEIQEVGEAIHWFLQLVGPFVSDAKAKLAATQGDNILTRLLRETDLNKQATAFEEIKKDRDEKKDRSTLSGDSMPQFKKDAEDAEKMLSVANTIYKSRISINEKYQESEKILDNFMKENYNIVADARIQRNTPGASYYEFAAPLEKLINGLQHMDAVPEDVKKVIEGIAAARAKPENLDVAPDLEALQNSWENNYASLISQRLEKIQETSTEAKAAVVSYMTNGGAPGTSVDATNINNVGASNAATQIVASKLVEWANSSSGFVNGMAAITRLLIPGLASLSSSAATTNSGAKIADQSTVSVEANRVAGRTDNDVAIGRSAKAIDNATKSSAAYAGQTKLTTQTSTQSAAATDNVTSKVVTLKQSQDDLQKSGAAQLVQMPQLTKAANDQADAYRRVAEAQALQKLARDIQFQQDQMGRSTIDQTVASTQKQYGLPVDMNSASANIIRYNEQLKYARELAGDFASTPVSGLRNGEGLWKSLGKAAISVLTKISDRLLNDVLNSLFKVNSAAAGGGLFGGGGILGGLFGGGGGLDLGILARSPQAAAAVASGIPGLWADGGYTGPGGKHEPAGIVHAGEVVWSQKDIARAGGVGVVEAMRLGRRGYADGGVVGEGGPKLVRAQPDAPVPVRRLWADNQNDASGSASGVHVTVGVSVDEDGNLKAYVKNVAQSEAQSSTRQGLNDFNQQLPDRVAQINRNPRRR
ncbi:MULTISPECIES: hypothetical protein [Rhizobium]|uniref:Bacteriophage tail tape measure N-terminal domain-containing protein n=1 Tax=Rhizobium paranaense TaxID=1650438 RepID=A0A7W8XPP5_9HYPH|nr:MULTISPECIES: hypothetical protein [Rhizobium]MBB5573314.1 hypothetical protein [Rhizobium paranaense]